MNTFDTENCIKRFIEQLECDHFVEDIIERYNIKVISCGRRLLECSTRYSYIIPPYMDRDEFLDYIDGNGFNVVEGRTHNYFYIFPIYK